jgi:hypothetical protein
MNGFMTNMGKYPMLTMAHQTQKRSNNHIEK